MIFIFWAKLDSRNYGKMIFIFWVKFSDFTFLEIEKNDIHFLEKNDIHFLEKNE